MDDLTVFFSARQRVSEVPRGVGCQGRHLPARDPEAKGLTERSHDHQL
jgi:hypothetical protein